MTTERPAGVLREAAQAVVDFLAPQPFPGGNALLPQALYDTPVINDLRDALAALPGPDGLDVEDGDWFRWRHAGQCAFERGEGQCDCGLSAQQQALSRARLALPGPDGLDVERLSRVDIAALVMHYGPESPSLPYAIAREYAALPATPDAGKGEAATFNVVAASEGRPAWGSVPYDKADHANRGADDGA